MRVLIYKRTHTGDPDRHGCFGVNTCMGKVRGMDYDAVIGIGALTAEARSHGIDGRITWIGVGPRKDWSERAMRIDERGPQVRFDRFELWDEEGPLLVERAPMLARRFYEKNARYVLGGLSVEERAEANDILALVGKGARLARKRGSGGCAPRKKPRRCSPC
jgi:hypothetical protein